MIFTPWPALSSLYVINDRAERHAFWSQFLLFILLFFFRIFLGGKRKEEKNKQSRGQKPCFSARSFYVRKILKISNTVLYYNISGSCGFCRDSFTRIERHDCTNKINPSYWEDPSILILTRPTNCTVNRLKNLMKPLPFTNKVGLCKGKSCFVYIMHWTNCIANWLQDFSSFLFRTFSYELILIKISVIKPHFFSKYYLITEQIS